MDAVAASAAASHDDQVTNLRLRWPPATRRETDRATEHERVPYVAGVEQGCAVDGGDTHLVAVIGDAGDHALVNPLRGQRTWRKDLRRSIERAEAEDIGVG